MSSSESAVGLLGGGRGSEELDVWKRACPEEGELSHEGLRSVTVAIMVVVVVNGGAVSPSSMAPVHNQRFVWVGEEKRIPAIVVGYGVMDAGSGEYGGVAVMVFGGRNLRWLLVTLWKR